ncbi:D-amino acid dehydrogenase [Denitromonas iodatirespirans]|uniref:D-amino acid dehydrogenase n=1 Tax=Denitromonas iodatirespirans TaxID=2795389 RepID=A0A944D9T1_DENI1|nr:D-amino acid dehydrogenase [Denitromonas iodatirespirans]MBT0960628.1 D-amino acid dehydrogenase [Denitromonas iodatirespirans]
MHVMVLGAGLAGVTSAWYLNKAGFDVTVVERQSAPAMETSFANGGQISVSHPEPWANPSAPMTVLRWLGNDAAPLRFRPRADWRQWLWSAAFLRECLPWRTHRNTAAIAALARYSREQLRQLRDETGIDYRYQQRGILHLFFGTGAATEARHRAAALARLGITAEACDRDRALAIEPALAHLAQPPAGALFAPDDESGDAHAFVAALGEFLAKRGVQFRYDTGIERIVREGGRVSGLEVVLADGTRDLLEANAYVLCMGSYSPRLVAPLGEYLPVYPVKGYSVTLPVIDPARCPDVSLTDEARRIVCSRFGDRFRVAGTAELNGYDLNIDAARCQNLIDWTQRNFPGATDPAGAVPWCGLRPSTPSNRPLIGKGKMINLYYNTGHGSLGWTLACGSAAALADLMSGTPPRPDFPFLGSRFD